MAVQSEITAPKLCYIQKETTNSSFIKMHHYLKSVGIANNDFFLALLNPQLAGLDPYDPNLTLYQKSMIMNECRLNYWYFIREVVHIPQQGGSTRGARYGLNRLNLAYSFLSTMNFNTYLEAPRQTGKTVGVTCRILWIYNFGTTNSEMMFMHKDHTGSKKNLRDLKAIRDILPSYLQMASATGAAGKQLKVPNTIVMIENPHNRNKINTYPSARTKAAADNLGRGFTMPIQWYDEFAFLPYNKIIYGAATPAQSRAAENARANNAPYGIIITSTPGDMLTDSGAYAYSIVSESTKWYDKYYDFTAQQLYDLKAQNTNTSFWYVKFTYQQLGKDQNYFKEMVIDLNRDWPTIRREVLLEWALVSENCAFNQDDLDKIETFLQDPIRMLEFGQYRQYVFNVYEDLNTTYPPIIGVDVAGGTYQDSSAITIIDSSTTRVCATFNCNFIPTDDLASVVYELVTRYLPNAVVNIERNGVGHGVVSRLVKTSIKKNLYWEIKDKVIEEAFNGVRSEKVKRKVRVYGLDSTKDVRERLIEILYERVRYHKDKFIAKILLDEMRSMQVKKNGKIEHSDQTHDDQVFSYLLALYVWYDGQDLMDNWRIQKTTIRTDEEDIDEESIIEKNIRNMESLQLDKATSDSETDAEILNTLEWVEQQNNLITADDMTDAQKDEIGMIKSVILSNNTEVRKRYAEQFGLDQSNYIDTTIAMNQTILPDSLYDMESDDDNFDLYGYDDGNEIYKQSLSAPVVGNLANVWRKL